MSVELGESDYGEGFHARAEALGSSAELSITNNEYTILLNYVDYRSAGR
jgi:hypothetical protein